MLFLFAYVQQQLKEKQGGSKHWLQVGAKSFSKDLIHSGDNIFLWFVKLMFKLHGKGTLTSLSWGSYKTLKVISSLALSYFSQGYKHTALPTADKYQRKPPEAGS